MVSFPNAKINIGLNIIRKRQDGFHDIQSLFYPIGLYDVLEVTESDSDNLVLHSSKLFPREENIIWKIWMEMKVAFSLPPIDIHLVKNIPSGAGLGGGSSDGAFFINLIDKKFSLGLDEKERESLAGKFGSDCPFFIRNQPAIAQGRGEKLSSWEPLLKGYFLVLENPGIHVSTADAYRGVVPSKAELDFEDIAGLKPEDWRDVLRNGFEDHIFRKFPVLQDLKDGHYANGALYSSMSGSGSSIYGIYPGETGYKGKYPCWQGYL